MRLIDADALINTLKELEWITDDMENDTASIEDIINNAPTVEITDYDTGYQDGCEDGLNDIRPQGVWIATNGTYYCSQCKHYAFDRQRFDFCQDCGADMRGDRE